MATNDPKKHSITGNLVANMLTEREDDYTFNVTYTANRTIKDLCKLAAKGKSKFTASELENAYNDLEEQAKIELFNAATVEFGLANNSLGVDGSFIGPGAKFDPIKRRAGKYQCHSRPGIGRIANHYQSNRCSHRRSKWPDHPGRQSQWRRKARTYCR